MDEYIGIVKLFAGTFAPRGWAFCDGSLRPIAQYSAVFSLLGTTYGGDGQTTFALPDLRGRAAIGAGAGAGLTPRQPGEKSGTENVTLTSQQMPMHTHGLGVSNVAGTSNSPVGTVLAQANYTDGDGNPVPVTAYGTAADAQAGQAVTPSGGNQPFGIMPPFLGMSYIICMEGLYPSRD